MYQCSLWFCRVCTGRQVVRLVMYSAIKFFRRTTRESVEERWGLPARLAWSLFFGGEDSISAELEAAVLSFIVESRFDDDVRFDSTEICTLTLAAYL